MKYLKLYEELEIPDPNKAKKDKIVEYIDWEMLKDIKDMALEYIDDRFILTVKIYLDISNEENLWLKKHKDIVCQFNYDHNRRANIWVVSNLRYLSIEDITSAFYNDNLKYYIMLSKSEINDDNIFKFEDNDESRELLSRVMEAYPDIKLYDI